MDPFKKARFPSEELLQKIEGKRRKVFSLEKDLESSFTFKSDILIMMCGTREDFANR